MQTDTASDRADIAQLLAEYAHAVDRRDFAAVAACFLPDATANYGGNELGPGIDEIVAYIRGVERFVATQHLFGVPLVRLHGDVASATTHAVSYLVERTGAAETVLGRGLTYDDDLVRTNGGWRIRRRVHRPIWSTVGALDWAGSPPVPVPGDG